jgi:hypothetical protein
MDPTAVVPQANFSVPGEMSATLWPSCGLRHSRGGRKKARLLESRTENGHGKEMFMSNMSDCRYRRIVTDLSDCEDAIEELFNGVTDDGRPLSDDELRAARRLVTSCINIVTLVADMARVEVDLDGVEQSIETVLRKANSATLEARYDARDARLLLSKVAE